jgi:L-amino acid N-acyltransferase YncA
VTAAGLHLRPAESADAEALASIYNEGIAGRDATFETEPRSGSDFAGLLGPDGTPALVAELDGSVVGGAWTVPYSDRACYAGILDISVYVTAAARGRGIGTALCDGVASAAASRGYHKLVSKLFTDNEASRRLTKRCGFREVGLHLRHGQLEGRWLDVVLVERLLGEPAGG